MTLRWRLDAHRDDGKRFVVRADEKPTAFMELEAAIRACQRRTQLVTKQVLASQFAPQGSHAEQREAKQRNCPAAIRNAHSHRSDLENEPLVRSSPPRPYGRCLRQAEAGEGRVVKGHGI